ncbi:hypothetical protein JCM17823_24610 [Halorubrum gandharaense]
MAGLLREEPGERSAEQEYREVGRECGFRNHLIRCIFSQTSDNGWDETALRNRPVVSTAATDFSPRQRRAQSSSRA